MATGAVFYMNISQVPEDATLLSTVPAVAVIESVERLGDRQRFTVRAAGRGTARLEVRMATGELVDWVELEVRDPAVLRLPNWSCSPGPEASTTDTLRLVVGDSCYLAPEALDAQGEELATGQAAVWHPTHTMQASQLFETEANLLEHGAVAIGTFGPFMRLDAHAEGRSLVGCAVGSVFTARTIVVVDPDGTPPEDE